MGNVRQYGWKRNREKVFSTQNSKESTSNKTAKQKVPQLCLSKLKYNQVTLKIISVTKTRTEFVKVISKDLNHSYNVNCYWFKIATEMPFFLLKLIQQ